MVKYKNLIYSELIKELYDNRGYNLDVDLVLYKGLADKSSLPDFLYADPSIGIRPSKTVKENGNIYNLLLNNLPQWRKYPKREKSIITTSNIKTAEGYALPLESRGLRFGKVYVVVPKVNSRIVIAPKNDILYSFVPALKNFKLRGKSSSLVAFNLFMAEIFNVANIGEGYDLDWKLFKGYLRSLSNGKIEVKGKLSNDAENILKSFKECNGGLINWLDEIFSPKNNYFETKKYDLTLMRKSYYDNEIWTDSSCYLIEINKFDSIKKTL